ncbi:MAG: aminoacetone oxidase family FAD-binding enzyme [Phycisphaerales bacterium]|nr:aminoacetone oxidase family FAD-binding enzyme [Phycisphaerales bacterium]
MTSERVDIAVIGAGAAGLFAAIWAGRAAKAAGLQLSIVALDGASKLGAKVLVAGGGRCNVTHHAVDESAYAGSSRNAIKKVLRSFGVEKTTAFFAELGVELKREETGKLFPTTDDAHTVLDALLAAARDAGVELRHPWRVSAVERTDGGFFVSRSFTPEQAAEGRSESLLAGRIILATGGMALPRSGSDGAGYAFARSLGHSVTPQVFPSLVPLTTAEGWFLKALSGIAVPATLTVTSGTGKKLASFTNSTLFTHFGLSGPGPLDVSRYYLEAKREDPGAKLLLNLLPGADTERFDALLVKYRDDSPVRILSQHPCGLPERLARALCDKAGVYPSTGGVIQHMPREVRRGLATLCTAMDVPVTGSRGFTFAEVTAGGVPLSELHLNTMASRVCPGLSICGEVCDVDGRIGGFNFQWAWASGYLAGTGAAIDLLAE